MFKQQPSRSLFGPVKPQQRGIFDTVKPQQRGLFGAVKPQQRGIFDTVKPQQRGLFSGLGNPKQIQEQPVNQQNKQICPICRKTFDVQKRIPMMVCTNLHDLCQSCLGQPTQNSLFFPAKISPCPVCKQEMINRDKIKKNRYLIKSLEEGGPQYKNVLIDEDNLRLRFLMNELQILTEELLKQKCQRYTCPLTQFVTLDPVQLKCCKNFFQNVPIHTWVNLNRTCPTCRKQITQKDIETRESQLFERRDAIKMLRMQIRKTFMILTEKTNQEQWKEKIENYMGIGYTSKSL